MASMSTGKIVGIILLCIFVLFVFSAGCFFASLLGGGLGGVFNGPGDSVYIIRLEGIISASSYTGLFGDATVTPEEIIGQLEDAQGNPGVKAILLRINSPGGSPAASQEIYEELKKAKKPVVVSVSDACASGAYYVASAADKIIANKSSSVGSIGVIMQIANREELYEKLGLKYTTIKQGKYKDIGSPDRPLNPEEMALLEEQTRKVYEQFIADVAAGRGMEIETVRELATGWVFLGTEALELGLIDGIGTYKDAIGIAAELGGIEGEPNIIRQDPGFSLFDLILGYYIESGLSKIFNF